MTFAHRWLSAPDLVTLFCPFCWKEILVPRDENDPQGTVTVRYPCPTCEGRKPPKGQSYPIFIDKDGNRIEEANQTKP